TKLGAGLVVVGEERRAFLVTGRQPAGGVVIPLVKRLERGLGARHRRAVSAVLPEDERRLEDGDLEVFVETALPVIERLVRGLGLGSDHGLESGPVAERAGLCLEQRGAAAGGSHVGQEVVIASARGAGDAGRAPGKGAREVVRVEEIVEDRRLAALADAGDQPAGVVQLLKYLLD